MATSYGALCNDFHVNHKLALKMDLPTERDTVLHLFDRVRKTVPSMDRFRRYQGELVLESSRREPQYNWMSLRQTSICSGHVNPDSMEQAYAYHQFLIEIAPYHLSISPLDVDYCELMLGFDLECSGNHDEVVYQALFMNTPLENLMRTGEGRVLEVQPVFGMTLNKKGDTQAYFEVKTRARSRRGKGRFRDEPISVLLSIRKYGPVSDLEALKASFGELTVHAETLATEKLVPDLLAPISRQIAASNA